jgi:hypothetical protein
MTLKGEARTKYMREYMRRRRARKAAPQPVAARILEIRDAAAMITNDCSDTWSVFVEAHFGRFESKAAAQAWVDAQKKMPNPQARARIAKRRPKRSR